MIATCVIGDGEIQKQTGYIIISNYVKTWINYSKPEGTDKPNIENQHKIICMEIRVKFRKSPATSDLNKHMPIDIKAMGGNKHRLWIAEENKNRENIERTVVTANKQKRENRPGNKELWGQIQTAIFQKQKEEYPTGEEI